MSKRIRLSLAAQEKQVTDWSKCFICQEDKIETLVSPSSRRNLTRSGYETLSKNIPEFSKINDMPIPLDIRRLDEGDGIEETLLKNQAKYHESCRLRFNSSKLKRAQHRQSSTDHMAKDDKTSTKFTRKRSAAEIEEDKASSLGECFICEKQVPLMNSMKQ